MKKWEYKTVSIKAETTHVMVREIDTATLLNNLNPLGSEGWEAVSSVAVNVADGLTSYVYVLLKRQIE
jgi:gamma-glutamylcyclotransferase (GGCT)/AIG2-like uncharacterized protein YtfP